jgi:NADPH-dependent curcumin reductase CurA
MGALGLGGFTAFYGFNIIGQTTAEDVMVVSFAAGSPGSMVVQIANMIGCKRVIGIAGGEMKCKWVEGLGADAFVNYKSKSFEEDLVKATGVEKPDVNVFFDNVGGEILDLMFTRMCDVWPHYYVWFHQSLQHEPFSDLGAEELV